MKDVIIIGAGVIGASIARELSKYELDILLLEKENDVSCGASKANSGIVHGGYDAPNGSKKGKYSRRGNQMFDQLNEELNFGFKRCGSMVLAFSQEEVQALDKLYQNGILNGVDDLEFLDKESILKMETYINSDVLKALYCPSAGITSPYELTIALAENAISNGVTLRLKTEVTSIVRKRESFVVITSNDEEFESKVVINCAGAYSDKVAHMIGDESFYIIPRAGEYILLHKKMNYLANHVLFQAPSDKGKGILVTPTVRGNLMLGPNATEVQNPEAVGTNLDNLKYIATTAMKTTPDIDLKFTLRTFSGIRATSNRHDFIIGMSDIAGFYHVAGIESPGLTSSPAIAQDVSKEIVDYLGDISLNEEFNPHRKGIIVEKDDNFKGNLTSDDPDEHIICRCEQVTESEIIDALHRGIDIESLDAIKRRTRAGMGPCQGNFCGTHVQAIVARELGLEPETVTWRGAGSSSLPKREDRTFWKQLQDDLTKEKI